MSTVAYMFSGNRYISSITFPIELQHANVNRLLLAKWQHVLNETKVVSTCGVSFVDVTGMLLD